MRKVIVLFVFLLASMHAYAQDNTPMTLDECIKTGMENSKTLKIAKYKVEAAEEKLKEANIAFLPTLKFSGSYTKLSPVDPFSVMGITISPSVLNNYTSKFTLSQPLFTGSRISGNSEMMESNLQSLKADYNREKNQMVYDIKTAFWSYYKAQELKTTIIDNIKQVEAHLRDAENMMNLGMATNNDVLRIKVQLSNNKLLLLEANNNVELGMIGLNNILGLPINRETNIIAKPDTSQIKAVTLESLLNEAMKNRPELKSMEYRIKMNESSVTISKSPWYPQISAGANYYYSNPNPRIFPTQNEFKGTWDLNLMISYDIWNWMLTSHQTSQAKLNLEQSKVSLEQMKDGIRLEVNQVYLGLIKAKERIPVTMETIAAAEENYRVTSEKYKQGLALNSDVIDAEASLLLGRITYITSIVDYELMLAKLEKAINK